MTSHKSIRVRRTNINEPEDFVDFDSIHSAMRKCKKSFITIKQYCINKMEVNGYRWEIISKSLSPNTTVNELNNLLDETSPEIKYSVNNDVYIIEPFEEIDSSEDSPVSEISVTSPQQPHPECEVTPWDTPFTSKSKTDKVSQSKFKRQPCTCSLM
jgi:hypothetical protein